MILIGDTYFILGCIRLHKLNVGALYKHILQANSSSTFCFVCFVNYTYADIYCTSVE
jgi:hypothetical protein